MGLRRQNTTAERKLTICSDNKNLSHQRASAECLLPSRVVAREINKNTRWRVPRVMGMSHFWIRRAHSALCHLCLSKGKAIQAPFACAHLSEVLNATRAVVISWMEYIYTCTRHHENRRWVMAMRRPISQKPSETERAVYFGADTTDSPLIIIAWSFALVMGRK